MLLGESLLILELVINLFQINITFIGTNIIELVNNIKLFEILKFNIMHKFLLNDMLAQKSFFFYLLVNCFIIVCEFLLYEVVIIFQIIEIGQWENILLDYVCTQVENFAVKFLTS